jgi:purine-nucleoside phosphorylase
MIFLMPTQGCGIAIPYLYKESVGEVIFTVSMSWYKQKKEKAATELGLGDILRRGVYVMIGGPTFETVAESRLLKNFGADAVGE